ncbi:MAG: hypothetical protein ACLQSR_17080 [Limisphaerales bacterium]
MPFAHLVAPRARQRSAAASLASEPEAKFSLVFLSAAVQFSAVGKIQIYEREIIMNAERLHAIALVLRQEMVDKGIVSNIGKLCNALDKVTNLPQPGQHG